MIKKRRYQLIPFIFFLTSCGTSLKTDSFIGAKIGFAVIDVILTSILVFSLSLIISIFLDKKIKSGKTLIIVIILSILAAALTIYYFSFFTKYTISEYLINLFQFRIPVYSGIYFSLLSFFLIFLIFDFVRTRKYKKQTSKSSLKNKKTKAPSIYKQNVKFADTAYINLQKWDKTKEYFIIQDKNLLQPLNNLISIERSLGESLQLKSIYDVVLYDNDESRIHPQFVLSGFRSALFCNVNRIFSPLTVIPIEYFNTDGTINYNNELLDYHKIIQEDAEYLEKDQFTRILHSYGCHYDSDDEEFIKNYKDPEKKLLEYYKQQMENKSKALMQLEKAAAPFLPDRNNKFSFFYLNTKNSNNEFIPYCIVGSQLIMLFIVKYYRKI